MSTSAEDTLLAAADLRQTGTPDCYVDPIRQEVEHVMPRTEALALARVRRAPQQNLDVAVATTTPTVFTGMPTLDAGDADTIHSWYLSALRDEDKATDIDDCSYYWGMREAYESVLMLLFGVEPPATISDVSGTG